MLGRQRGRDDDGDRSGLVALDPDTGQLRLPVGNGRAERQEGRLDLAPGLDEEPPAAAGLRPLFEHHRRPGAARHGALDWLLVLAATAVFVAAAAFARVPALEIGWGWAAALTLALVGFLVAGGVALWRTTRFG